MSSEISPGTKRRGRPAQYLLSGIAICGVCGAKTRIGTQNADIRQAGGTTQQNKYRVYECAGKPGQSGFHISMRQEHLDEIVTDAVIARVIEAEFSLPRVLADARFDEERAALRLEIKSDRVWLDSVRAASIEDGRPSTLHAQEQIVLPRIEAARARLEQLEKLDPLVVTLRRAHSAERRWNQMQLTEQRHVVSALLTPRINPVTSDDYGQRGPNASRVELLWHGRDD